MLEYFDFSLCTIPSPMFLNGLCVEMILMVVTEAILAPMTATHAPIRGLRVKQFHTACSCHDFHAPLSTPKGARAITYLSSLDSQWDTHDTARLLWFGF